MMAGGGEGGAGSGRSTGLCSGAGTETTHDDTEIIGKCVAAAAAVLRHNNVHDQSSHHQYMCTLTPTATLHFL